MARTESAEGGRRTSLGTAAALVVGGAVLWFAVEGGEWGTSDLVHARRRLAATQQEIDSLRGVVDSLVLRRKRLQTDVVLQERIAREEFGMVKGDRELVYLVIASDTADSAAARRER